MCLYLLQDLAGNGIEVELMPIGRGFNVATFYQVTTCTCVLYVYTCTYMYVLKCICIEQQVICKYVYYVELDRFLDYVSQ